MITKTFGSDEGFEATHDAMLQYLTKPFIPGIAAMRVTFHTSFNLGDMTQLLNMLEFVMSQAAQVINEALQHSGSDYSQTQELLDWAERQYRDIAAIVGVELV